MPAASVHTMPFGAHCSEHGVRFRLYAPTARAVSLVYDGDGGPVRVPLARGDDGFCETTRSDARAGTRYRYDVDGLLVPDPASRFQPDGVHGPSVVVDPRSFSWPDDGWRGRPWHEHVFYELHVGTFTPEGSYAAVRGKLDALVDLGVTALELMPLAAAPGARNWGYDGVLPYAPSANYGTPDDLKALIAAAHARGLAVYLDVVYNHFGPEGNYLHAYARDFSTDRVATPWGDGFDVAARPVVRSFFIENALYWLDEYRFDGLRLDAVHAIADGPERRFLLELGAAVRARAPEHVRLILENDENESRLLSGAFRAQWSDDVHHAAHVALTGERDGYYGDFADDPLARLGGALTQGFAFAGEASPFRGGRARGEPSAHLPLASFVTFMQNHDQVGNRPMGERLAALAPPAAVRAAAATLLLAPPIPLLFMGEEWAASSPFLFFCDFEPDLARAVREGRRAEFASFVGFAEGDALPDPGALETFARSTLRWDEREREPHRSWLAFYRALLHLRAREIAPRATRVRGLDAAYERRGRYGLAATWRLDDGTTLALDANLGPEPGRAFRSRANARALFALPDDGRTVGNAGNDASPWSVRWTLA
jgi:maltooligosyltrehalose trehalohydrolase